MFQTPTRRHLLLLAPDYAEIPMRFHRAEHAPRSYDLLLHAMQRFRARVYLGDGAIGAEDLTPDGRHVQPVDIRSWHVLALQHGEIVGCARFRPLDRGAGYEQMGIRHSALAGDGEWARRLRKVVERDIAEARERGLGYCEFGGWALSEEVRGTTECLRLALATFALTKALGGYIGVSTATKRHSSSSILRRLGGRSFEWRGMEVPSYFDPQYGCEMELLRFEKAESRFESWLATIARELEEVKIACRQWSETPAAAVGLEFPAATPVVTAPAETRIEA